MKISEILAIQEKLKEKSETANKPKPKAKAKPSLKKALKVQVPVKLTGTAPGEKKGGTLNHVIRVLNMECLPDNIPEAIEAPINELDLGQSIHVSDLNIPESANVLTPAGATVAIVNVEKVKEETTAEEETVETEAKPTETATGDAENK